MSSNIPGGFCLYAYFIPLAEFGKIGMLRTLLQWLRCEHLTIGYPSAKIINRVKPTGLLTAGWPILYWWWVSTLKLVCRWLLFALFLRFFQLNWFNNDTPDLIKLKRNPFLVKTPIKKFVDLFKNNTIAPSFIEIKLRYENNVKLISEHGNLTKKYRTNLSRSILPRAIHLKVKKSADSNATLTPGWIFNLLMTPKMTKVLGKC